MITGTRDYVLHECREAMRGDDGREWMVHSLKTQVDGIPSGKGFVTYCRHKAPLSETIIGSIEVFILPQECSQNEEDFRQISTLF